MKPTVEQYKDWWNAVAFAEAGEWETAREMTPDPGPRTTTDWLERIFIAVAFAEEGLHDEALQIATGNKVPFRPDRSQPFTVLEHKSYFCN